MSDREVKRAIQRSKDRSLASEVRQQAAPAQQLRITPARFRYAILHHLLDLSEQGNAIQDRRWVGGLLLGLGCSRRSGQGWSVRRRVMVLGSAAIPSTARGYSPHF